MKTITYILSVFILFSFQNSQAMGYKKGKGKDKMFKALNLTKEQKAKKEALFKEYEEKMKPLFAKEVAVQDKLKKAFENEATDAELTKLHDEFHGMRLEFSKIKFERKMKIRAMLTPEQRKTFSKQMSKHMDKHKKRKGKNCSYKG